MNKVTTRWKQLPLFFLQQCDEKIQQKRASNVLKKVTGKLDRSLNISRNSYVHVGLVTTKLTKMKFGTVLTNVLPISSLRRVI